MDWLKWSWEGFLIGIIFSFLFICVIIITEVDSSWFDKDE